MFGGCPSTRCVTTLLEAVVVNHVVADFQQYHI